jgi:phosphohistidine phosphatase
MKILLIRHAIAEDLSLKVQNDFDRALTDEGRKKIKETAKGIAKWVKSIDLILSSPLLRTRQTSEILSKEFDDVEIEKFPPLAPGSDIEQVTKMIRERVWQKHSNLKVLACVGHEPTMGILCSYLLATGSKDRTFVHFKKGAVACLDFSDKVEESSATLDWFIEPKMARKDT